MSLLGDPVSLRHGRSSSEISIYDYPEHLNPFYEDENHKRIRFWKIGKNRKYDNDGNKSVGGQSRRNSFSFGGLKDMWAFKSFRSKKSSSLGVNKTSESPPRTDCVDIRDTNYGNLDNKSRYSADQQQFQRNVPYRSSLQDMRFGYQSSSPTFNNRTSIGRNNQTNDFRRNEMYRATIQTPSRYQKRYQQGLQSSPKLQGSDRRYVYGGSITPQPIRNSYNIEDSIKCKQKNGSSQLSVASSTNPFEDNDEDNLNSTWHGETNNNKNGDVRIENGTNSLTRPSRKKRRAPQPPVTISLRIEEEPNKKDEVSRVYTNGTAIEQEEIIENNQKPILTPEEEEISNLTAQIESFVNETCYETNLEKSIPPVPPERKYFKENISKVENVPTEKTSVSSLTKTEDIKNGVVETCYETNLEKSIPPVPPERKYFKENISKVENVPTEKTSVSSLTKTEDIKNGVIVKQQKSVTIQQTPIVIISEPITETDYNYEIKSDNRDIVVDQPQKVIVHKSNVQKIEIHTTTISNNDFDNKKILNTDPKPIHNDTSINENNTEMLVTEENKINSAPCNIISSTETSPKKEKPPLSRKPNLNDIQFKYLKENHINDEKVNVKEKDINTLVKIEQEIHPSQKTETYENDDIPQVSYQLKITESTEDISDEIANEIVTLPYVPLKTSDSSTNNNNNQFIPNSDKNMKKSSSEVELRDNLELSEIKLDNDLLINIRPRSHFTDEEPEHRRLKKYERKKSVREIIESINKNQSLLKMNNKNSTKETNNFGEPKDLEESRRECKKLLNELESYNFKNKIYDENFNTKTNNEVDVIFQKIDQLNENGNIFKKCNATHHINGNSTIITPSSPISSREASPTTSNLDWNPVPKPKRTKKLNNDIITTTSSSPENNERLIE